MATLTSTQVAAYRRDGYLIVPGLYAPADVVQPLAAVESLFFGMPFSIWLERHAALAPRGSIPDGVAPMPDGRRTRWPTGDERLDRLIENAKLLSAAAELLGEQPFFCAGVTFLRCGPTDDRFPPTIHAGWHFDHFNNGLLPPSPTSDRHDYMNVVVFLHDVDEQCAPILFLPGTHQSATEIVVSQLATDNFVDGTLRDVRRVTGLPAPVAAVARAGDVLFYSSFVLHSPQPFGDRRRRRALWTLSLGRRSNAAWCRHDNPFGYENRAITRIAIARTTTAVRTLLGWPPPGDPYYSPSTLAALASCYPGIDLADYRR